MTDRDPHVTLVRPEGSEQREQAQLPHEQLDTYDVLEDAYRSAMSWQGVSWAKGSTGDQLKRSASSAVLRYTEGYYADGGNKTSLWKGARASCGEAAAAIQLLTIDGKVSKDEAARVRALFGSSHNTAIGCSPTRRSRTCSLTWGAARSRHASWPW